MYKMTGRIWLLFNSVALGLNILCGCWLVVVYFSLSEMQSSLSQSSVRSRLTESKVLLPKGIPAVTQPKFQKSNEFSIPDEALVIGIELEGVFRAYAVSAFNDRFSSFPASLAAHIVSHTIAGKQICVTHCHVLNSTKVFFGKDDSHTDLEVIGFDDGMQLLVDGKRFAQTAVDFPLDELPFVTTTWKRWRDQHPDSEVYIGERSVAPAAGNAG